MPLLAVATVTSNFARMALTAVGIIPLTLFVTWRFPPCAERAFPFRTAIASPIPLTVCVCVAAITLVCRETALALSPAADWIPVATSYLASSRRAKR